MGLKRVKLYCVIARNKENHEIRDVILIEKMT